VLRTSRTVDHSNPGNREHVRIPRHDHQGLSRHGAGRRGQVGSRRVPAHLRQVQGMTVRSSTSGPDATGARAAVVSAPVVARSRGWLHTQTSRRLAFGYLLLAPAVCYVVLLVGAPFVFSLYLALSDANVGDTAASFVGLENFRAALETDVFYTALRNSIMF